MIITVHDKNPKQYRKILNDIENKNDSEAIDLNTLHTFFKDLNEERAEDNDANAENFNIHIDEDIDDYRNFPKFSDRYACANSADPDQTSPGAVLSGSTLFAIPSASFGLVTLW